MTASRVIPPGAICATGGIQVDSGIDTNANGVLDTDEIDNSETICNGTNGSNGATSLIATSVEPVGVNCPFGGTLIQSGIDSNGDTVLQMGEVTATEFLCGLSSTTFDGLVYQADANIDGMQELFRTAKGPAAVDKLIGPKLSVGDVSSFLVSPDKTKVAVRGDLETDEVFELFVISLIDDSAPVKVSGALVEDGNVFSGFQWSPDSSRLAYRADQTTNNVSELYSVLADGTGNVKVSGTLVTGGDVQSGFGFQWSPDSSRLAYFADQTTDNVFELYSVSPDASGNVKVSGTLVANGDVQLGFQWSPDSSRLAYQADQTTDQVFELYSVLADGTGNVRVSGTLAAGGNVFSGFQWSPDSSRLAYQADQTTNEVFELYSVLADGTGNVKVSGSLVTGGLVYTFLWSPDSSRLAYRAEQETFLIVELYSVLADGMGNVKVSGALVAGGDVQSGFQWSPDSSRLAY